MSDESDLLRKVLKELKLTNEKLDSLASNVDLYIRSELEGEYVPAPAAKADLTPVNTTELKTSRIW